MLTREKRLSRAFESIRELFRNRWQLAFAVQTLVVVGLLTFYIAQGPEPVEYTTLTIPESSSPEGLIRVVFDPGLDGDEIAKLLEPLALDFVSGPSERGVATLRPTGPDAEASPDELISQLLNQPGVLFAVPVTRSEP